MSHARYAEMLAIYRDLSDGERAEVERHLLECPECAARLKAYRAMDRDLRELAPPGPGSQARARFQAALAAREPRGPWRSLRRAGLRLGNTAAWLIVSLVAAALVLSLALNWHWLVAGRDYPPAHGERLLPTIVFQPLPADRPYEDAAASPVFEVSGTVTLRDEITSGRRRVIFEVQVENKSKQPIRGLLARFEPPEALSAYEPTGYTRLPCGTLEPVDLVPGEVPYGLIVDCERGLPDPGPMPSAEQRRLYEALRQPIRLGLWWEGGEAYLELQPEDILYTGFPDWAQYGFEPSPLRARVELDISSDQPNPSWTLQGEEALQVVAAMYRGGYPPPGEAPRCDPQSPYRGFLVTLSEGPRGLPLSLHVCGGRIEVREVGSDSDPGIVQDLGHELEWFLLESGGSRIDAEVRETVRRQIERSTQPDDATPYAHSRVSEYRLAGELPEDLPAEAPVYRVVEGPVPEAEWARQVAAALGFSGEPVNESRAAAQPEWTWTGPERDQVLTVYGNIGYQCSAPPAGSERTGGPETAGEAIAAARGWLAARDLLPADCADDVQAWPGVDGLGWEVRFRRRLDGRPVGSYWSCSGGLMVHLNSVGQVESLAYVRRDVEPGELAPLKTMQEAWQELQTRGPGLFDPEGVLFPQYGVFTIDEIDLSYREGSVGTSEQQTELRPYYVFSGQAEVPNAGQNVRMAAYVPAWR